MVCELLWFGLYPFDYKICFDCNWFGRCCIFVSLFIHKRVQCVYNLHYCSLIKGLLFTICTTDSYIFLYVFPYQSLIVNRNWILLNNPDFIGTTVKITASPNNSNNAFFNEVKNEMRRYKINCLLHFNKCCSASDLNSKGRC